jgi:hypothetical protein
MEGYFYITRNLIDGKFYYGSGTVSTLSYYGSGLRFNRARKKYGDENFEHTPLKYFKTRQEAFDFEDRFLKLFKISKNPNSYNMKDAAQGGDTFSNNPNKEITREKMRNSAKGKIRSKEHCYNISKAKIGKKISNTINMSISKQGEKNNMYGQGHKISGEKNGQYGKTGKESPNWGKKHKPETIALMKEKAIKGPRSEDAKENIKEGILNKLKYEIHQLDKKTNELVEIFRSVKEASDKLGIKYHKVYSNLDENFLFIRVKKD